jgi:hypothetical protein
MRRIVSTIMGAGTTGGHQSAPYPQGNRAPLKLTEWHASALGAAAYIGTECKYPSRDPKCNERVGVQIRLQIPLQKHVHRTRVAVQGDKQIDPHP